MPSGPVGRNSVEGVPPRERLFREAIHPFEHVRKTARKLLKALASEGYDPGDPEFVPSDYELPAFGSFALHLLGWPDHWVREPYEHQMRRVMEQHAQLRAPGDRSDFWLREAGRALSAFLLRGEVPVEDELELYVLTVGEMLGLHADYCGHGDPALLDAFDVVAKAAGPQRKEALARLGPFQVRFTESVR